MNRENGAARNGFIDIQKFFYAWIIVIFHFYEYTHEHFEGGGTSVEFFLIVSGAFFFAGYKRRFDGIRAEDRLNYPVQYIKKRLLRFLPYTLPAFAVAFIVRVVITDDGKSINSVAHIIDLFVRNIWEIPLISMCGLTGGRGMINGVTWTISTMLIVEFLILNFLVRGEKTFCSFLAPIAMLIGCGFWAQIEDTSHLLWHGFTTFGVIRTFIMTCAGIYAWKGAEWLSKQKISAKGRKILTFLEISIHTIAIISMTCRSTRYYRMFLALLFTIAITITLSHQGYTAKWFRQNKVTDFLGEWSMAIYVIHKSVGIFLYKFYESPYEYYRLKYIYGVLVVFASLVILYLARWINHTAPRVAEKARSIFIDDELSSKI